MILQPLKNIDLFCQKAEDLGVFGTKSWLSVYGPDLKVVGIYRDDMQMIGGFYYVLSKKMGLSFVKLPPYTPHCGLFFISENKNMAAAGSVTKEVMTSVCNYLNKLKPAITILAFPSTIIDMQPFIWGKYKVVPNYTYRINLHKSMEEILSNFDPKNRNVINKALKQNLELTDEFSDKMEIYKFLVSTLQSRGANIYTNELKRIFYNFSRNDNSFAYSARMNGKLVGVVFCIIDRINCYYLLGGVDKESGISGLNSLLILRCIEKAKKLGCALFDFEGSMLKGVEKFFRSFGPELTPYYTINKAKLPLEMLLKFKKRELF